MPSSLTSLIDSYTKDPSCTVRFNNNRTRDVLSVEISEALDGAITSCNIRCANNPGISPEAKVTVMQGYNGQEQLTFTGIVDTVEYNNADRTYTVSARDMLKKAMDTFLVQEVKFGADPNTGMYYYSTPTGTGAGDILFTVHEYSSLSALHSNHPETTTNITNEGAKAHAVVQWLIHMTGLAEGTQIQVDDSNFFIGDLGPAKFHLTSIYDACSQIANLIGWRVYCDPAGVVHFKKKPRKPGGYPRWTYNDNQEPYNIKRLQHQTTNLDLRNYVEVRGASGIKYVVRSTSQYIGNTPYRGVLISDELIDTQGMAVFVANRVLNDLNRLKVTVTLEADGNPYLVPGSTVKLTGSRTGEYLVESLQTSMSAEAGYTISMTASQYYGDTVFEPTPSGDISAAWSVNSVVQMGDPKIIVQFDGSPSYSSQAPITSYFWEWPDSTTSTGITAWFVFDKDAISNGNSQNISLTVTDGVGNTATTTSGITLESLLVGNTLKYRQLYGALTDRAVGSIDGGGLWATVFIPATAVAASNFGPGGVYVASGHALFGTSAGQIHKTIDGCNSTNLMYTVAGGSKINDMHIPELDSTKALACTQDGKVYYSADTGVTWAKIGEFSFPIKQVKMGYTDFNYVWITGSGTNHAYETHNLGSSWAQVVTGVNGNWQFDSNVKNYLAHTVGIKNLSEGSEMTFNGGGTPNVVAGTYQVDIDDSSFAGSGLMAVDSTGQHWNYSASGQLTQTQYNPNNKTRHMIRDGDLPMVVYYATQSGISKSLNSNVTIQRLCYPDFGDSQVTGPPPPAGYGEKVAYGPLAGIIGPPNLVLRGRISIASGVKTGLFYSTIASGWKYIEESSNMLLNAGGGTDAWTASALSPGYIAYKSGDDKITLVVLQASGNPVVYTDRYTVPVASGGDSISQVYITRNPNNKTPALYALVDQSGTPGTQPHYVCKFRDYLNSTNDTAPLITTQGANGGTPRWERILAPYSDKFVYIDRNNIFDSTYKFNTFDGDAEAFKTRVQCDELPAGQVGPYLRQSTAFDTDNAALIIGSLDGSFVGADVGSAYLKAGTGYLLGTPSLDNVDNYAYLSTAKPGGVYYLRDDDWDMQLNGGQDLRAHGIWFATDYGKGNSVNTLLFDMSHQTYTIEDGNYHYDMVPHWFSVSHSKDLTKDFLIFTYTNRVEPVGTPAFTQHVKFSIDNGDTWLDGPDMVVGATGYINDMWYIEPDTTT